MGLEDQGERRLTEGKWVGCHRFGQLACFGSSASNLHKAASYARSALGDRGAVVLRSGVVKLAPAAEVSTDVERFERGEDSAYGGELLPDEPMRSRPSARARTRQCLREIPAPFA